LCRQAIDDVEELCWTLNDPGLFLRKPSFLFASFKNHVAVLRGEFSHRHRPGLSIQWLEEKGIKKKFGFSKPAGILSQDGAEADVYKITHRILETFTPKRLQVYDNTEIISVSHKKNEVELTAVNNKKVRAKKLIIACDYESQKYIPFKVQDLQSTFAIASEPLEQKNFWYRNALLWETRIPYLYLRTTNDNRVIAGGKDIPFTNPNKRDHMSPQKAKSLEQSFTNLFRQIKFKTDFQWAGTFAATKDGLPFIGVTRQRPHTYFAFGFGGNGITFNAIY